MVGPRVARCFKFGGDILLPDVGPVDLGLLLAGGFFGVPVAQFDGGKVQRQRAGVDNTDIVLNIIDDRRRVDGLMCHFGSFPGRTGFGGGVLFPSSKVRFNGLMRVCG